MIVNPSVPLHRLVLSLSEGLDHVSPTVADHQLRVAYMSAKMARQMGFGGAPLRNVFHAGALHDIGLLRAEHRIRAVAHNILEGIAWHPEAGFALLRDNEFFAEAAPIIRHHHVCWDHGRGAEAHGQPVPLPSHILALADTVDRCIRRDEPILDQVDRLREGVFSLSGSAFHPACVEAFRVVSEPASFWLDTTSKRIYSILATEVNWPTLLIDEDSVGGIAHVFGRVVDSTSAWTATHSAGVAATAVALAERLCFSPREQALMRAAGYLHDLGKITVPSRVLDKRGKPDAREWALLQGHTYYTFRILNTIGGMPQISEWAGFHHERLDGKGYPFGHRAHELTLGARIMAVADTFTAITEDRPYRKGMSRKAALGVLERQASGGGLDGSVVGALRADFDGVDGIRRREQAEYAAQQKRLAAMATCGDARAGPAGAPVLLPSNRRGDE